MTIASGVFIIRKDGMLLVAHPTNHPDDFWSIPKGGAEEGELLLETAIRECFEETNINLLGFGAFTNTYLGEFKYTHNKKTLHAFLFIESKYSDANWDEQEIRCNSNVPDEKGGFPEMDDFKWVSLTEAEKLLHYTQVEALAKIRKIMR